MAIVLHRMKASWPFTSSYFICNHLLYISGTMNETFWYKMLEMKYFSWWKHRRTLDTYQLIYNTTPCTNSQSISFLFRPISLHRWYVAVIFHIADVVVYNLGSAPTSLELEHGNFHSTHGDSDVSFHTISQWHGWVFYFLSIDVCDGLVMVVFTFLLLCH